MKANEENKKSLKGLENQKINSENVQGGTKQNWDNETEKSFQNNNIAEGSVFRAKRKLRGGGGLTPTNSGETL